MGEQLGVMYDIKSGVVSLDYYNRTNFFFKSSLPMQRSDFYPHSENVWFSCLKTMKFSGNFLVRSWETSIPCFYFEK